MLSSSEQQLSSIHGRPYDVLLVSIIVPAIACVFTAGRFYVRLAITKAVKFDDGKPLLLLKALHLLTAIHSSLVACPCKSSALI